jgi:hypothetical protein
MARNYVISISALIGLLLIAVAYLLFNQIRIKKDINEEPVTDTMIFKEGMNWVTPVPCPDSLYFAGEPVPVDIFYVKEQLDRELTVNTYWHSSTLLMLKRAARWFPVIEPILKSEGIPEDFKYLTLIESGLMNVVSPSGAAGFWQFLENTAKEYGLEVNKQVDERYHVARATEAACRYLKKSHDRLGDWTLVAASYNAGQNRIASSIKDQHTRSFYEMHLNEETSRYIFRALAIKLIYEDPEKYGFRLKAGDLYHPLDVKTITVKSSIRNLSEWAQSQGISMKMLKELNPWLRSDKLTVRKGRSYQVILPRK